jgi:MFS family permease
MLLIGAAYFGKVAALPTLGRLAQRYGARRLLWIGGLGIVPGAGLWIVSHSFWYLLAVQLLTGACWAAYELAMFLMFFESIPKARRTDVLTLYNLGNTAALAGGALAGGALLSLFGPGAAAYLTLFGLSSALRVLALPLLQRVPEPERRPAAPATRVIGMQPEGGSDARPILSSMTPETETPVAEAA